MPTHSMKKEISKKDMDRLREHSKLHKGGMNSKHIKDMIKFMKMGMSFSAAHNKAVKGEKKKPPMIKPMMRRGGGGGGY